MKRTATWMAVLAAGALTLGAASADTFEQALTLEQGALKAQTAGLKQRVSGHNAEARLEEIDFRRGGDRGWRGGDRDHDHDGWRDHDHDRDRDHDHDGWRDRDHDGWRDRDGWHGADHGHEHDGWRGDRGWHPRGGPGPWGGWHHPGWGHDRGWGWQHGRWIWWGWRPWYAGIGMACDAYYAERYRDCSNDAWFDDAACRDDCASVGPYCAQQCDVETRNAVLACEYSYRSYWNCGGPVFWPPAGVVIRIP